MHSDFQINKYIGKEILCIKSYDYVVLNSTKKKFYKDSFYMFIDYVNLFFLDVIVEPDFQLGGIRKTRLVQFNRGDFFEHFELRTLVDVRRDKIKSILDE